MEPEKRNKLHCSILTYCKQNTIRKKELHYVTSHLLYRKIMENYVWYSLLIVCISIYSLTEKTDIYMWPFTNTRTCNWDSSPEILFQDISNLTTSNSPERFRLQLLLYSSKQPAYVPLTGSTVGDSPCISAEYLAHKLISIMIKSSSTYMKSVYIMLKETIVTSLVCESTIKLIYHFRDPR